MVEHMDRHLAEQIQGVEDISNLSFKRSRDWVDYAPDKAAKKFSSERAGIYQQPTVGTKKAGQTTMDGFINRPPASTVSDGFDKTSKKTEFTFVSDRPSGMIGTSGIIPKMQILLEASKAQGITKQAYLADPSVIFFQSDTSDRGWGCGYRNLQMMLSYIVQQRSSKSVADRTARNANPTKIGAIVPTIPELQQQIEYAWACGFDPPGAEQLKHKVEGTKKWIGTTEACYFRMPAWSPLTTPESLHVSDFEQVEADQRIIQTVKPPLYIQHQGHSRTVVGIEVLMTGELNLLVLDPGRWLHKSIPTLREASISRMRQSARGSKITAEDGLLDAQYLLKAFRLSLNFETFKPQYQLLGISGLYHERQGDDDQWQPNVLELLTRGTSVSIGWNEDEYLQSKSICSTRIPHLNTEKPLYFAVSKSQVNPTNPKDKLAADKKGSDLLDKLGKHNQSGSATTVITMNGPESPSTIITPSTASATVRSNSALNKVFSVRPITSWIDKLARDHGSPNSTALSHDDLPSKYHKRDLALKTMQDSYTEIILPFTTDKALLEEYINFGGTVRHGKILEDLDALAGAISYKHCDDGQMDSSPLTIVTASVDRIDFLKPFGVSDLRLSGHVTYVGYSSMEVFMKMEEISAEKPEKRGDTILVARFSMVARDALTGKAAQVNPLLLQNDAEKKLFQMGEENKARKRLASESALTKRPPTEEERFLIHDLYLEYSKYDDPQTKIKKPDDVEWMADKKMSAIQIMQPQDRNIHDKIFGGYLMRLAYELAYCNASVFIKYRPTFLALDEISFRKPVPVGTLLELDSQIAFAEGGKHHSFQVMVKADVLDVEKGTRETTNTFWFTFKNPKKVHDTPKVMPRTYAESMLYLEGKRRGMEGIKLVEVNRKNLGM
ncbi:hypothetical protein BGZ51_006053 [Haplosporangium sp. Z 767]|nr:hypothetical protein BGZ50_006292 [Haplosporangium sp. Z 11]KAF9180676.1 hypothetical protein BGZ51_006053 [Haplosporangium sp. Z 767]